MLQYIGRRLLALLPVLIVVGVIVFTIIHLTPGDPASVILGESATQEEVDQLRQALGLDQPLMSQFITWIGQVATGNLGTSVFSGEPVAQTIIDRLGPTVSLAIVACMVSLCIAIPTAILAVWKRDSVLDPAFMSVTLLGVSIPNFWLALLLILLFAVVLRWLPVAGYVPISEGVWSWLSHLILPAVVLSVQQAGIISRMLRDGMLDIMHQDYIRTARAKGLKERVVLIKHTLSNAMIPTTTVIGASIAGLLGGAVVTETIFAIPGIGGLIVESIARRDYPVLQGTVLFVATVYVIVNLLVDLTYAVLDPRIRYD
ncbi:ABC transporter permease [Brevibacillus reuszeri]|uniref:ABC transporter permease n=1 Tax=Brevibacillus reuszeri TaxID=54915 RepID=A0A0K9YXS8_9BACL|nr:ABC transporter permease [Brevibacillus reuszeri]KNB73457.1 peptide ABC transporter [Brevibacillus reuszeri]MED1858754.1 ABC transporter permease [Brevibacillus reuszeri]GED69734.1 ABC transporter permease [Brevibacillus reuszeri]